jgi:hypothetical protein
MGDCPPRLVNFYEMVCGKCGAYGASSISRGWLNPDVRKNSRTKQFSIAHAIEGNATCQAELASAGAAGEIAADSQHRFIED